jgi:hypothetical protein
MLTDQDDQWWDLPCDLDIFAEAIGYYDFLADLAQRGHAVWTARDEEVYGPRPDRWFINEDGDNFMVRGPMLVRECQYCVYDYKHPDGVRCEFETCMATCIQADRLPKTRRAAFAILTQWEGSFWHDTEQDRGEFRELYETARTDRLIRIIEAVFRGSREGLPMLQESSMAHHHARDGYELTKVPEKFRPLLRRLQRGTWTRTELEWLLRR